MKRITPLVIAILLSLPILGQNNSMEFSGNDYVSLGDNFGFSSTDQFTVEAWIKVTSTGNFQQIVSKLDGGFTGWGMQVRPDGRLSAYLFSVYGVNQRFVDGTAIVQDDTWHHVAMSWNGVDQITLYVDGEIDPISGTAPGGATLGSIATAADTHIGNYEGTGSPGEFLDGYVDDVRIWSGVRSDAEILANYNTELSGNETNLLAYYKFDNVGTACDVEDCNPAETHGSRGSIAGAEDLPVFSSEVPAIADVGCGVETVCSLNVDEFDLSELSVYPNPTVDFITVNSPNNNNELSYSIHNILGKQLVAKRSLEATIDFSEYPSGVYFVTLSNGERSVVKRVIKR